MAIGNTLTREQKQRLRKLKKKVYKLNYLNEELDDVIQTIDEYRAEFSDVMTSWLTQKNMLDVLDQLFPQKSKEELLSEIEEINVDEEIEVKQNKKVDPWTREIYRQIASETHSDKMAQRDDLTQAEKEKREKIFIEANAHLNENDGPALYIIAVDLGLKMSNVPDNILEYFDNSINELQGKISQQQNSHAWNWAEADAQKRKFFLKGLCERNNIETTDEEITTFLKKY